MQMKRVGVVGAGQMGAGIAQVCASIGKVVTLCDIKQDFVDNGIASIRKNLQRNVSKDRISQNQMDDTLGNVSTSSDNEALSNCDIVIEAIIEDVDMGAFQQRCREFFSEGFEFSEVYNRITEETSEGHSP